MSLRGTVFRRDSRSLRFDNVCTAGYRRPHISSFASDRRSRGPGTSIETRTGVAETRGDSHMLLQQKISMTARQRPKDVRGTRLRVLGMGFTSRLSSLPSSSCFFIAFPREPDESMQRFGRLETTRGKMGSRADGHPHCQVLLLAKHE